MHIGILFFSDTLLMEQQGHGIVFGRVVANNQFIKSLLLHTSDPITFIVGTEAETEIIREASAKLGWNRLPNIIPYLKAQKFFNENPLDVLHTLEPYLYKPIYLRNQLKTKNFAITGITHSLGHEPFLDWVLLNQVAQPKPYDALLCTSPTAVEVVNKMEVTVAPSLARPVLTTKKIVPLGIHVAEFAGPKTCLRDQFKLAKNTFVMLGFSRFSYRYKNDWVPLLLALHQNKKNMARPFCVFLAGDEGQDGYPPVLQQWINDLNLQENVRLIVNPTDADRKTLYKSADLFLALSDNVQETFGLTVIEAMSSGLPIVAADWNGYKSLVQQDVNGEFVKTSMLASCTDLDFALPIQLGFFTHLQVAQSTIIDTQHLAKILVKWSGAPELLTQMGKKSQELALNFDWQNVIQKFCAVWQELATQAKFDKSERNGEQPVLNYRHIFSHYPTQILCDTQKFERTPLGDFALKGDLPLNLYGGMDEVLKHSTMTTILLTLRSPLTLDSLTKRLATAQTSPDSIRYHTAWLYKYGLLKVC